MSDYTQHGAYDTGYWMREPANFGVMSVRPSRGTAGITTAVRTLTLFNTFTANNNNERFEISWGGNILRLQTQAIGSGVLRSITYDAATHRYFISGTFTYLLDGNSFSVQDTTLDNLKELGGANLRWKTGYFGTSVEVGGGTAESNRGARMTLQSSTVNIPAVAGATLVATNFIPAGSLVWGVTLRVLTSFGTTGGMSSFDIGYAADPDAWGATIGITAGTVTNGTNFTLASPLYFPAATNLILDANGANTFDNTGLARATVHYASFVAPIANP